MRELALVLSLLSVPLSAVGQVGIQVARPSLSIDVDQPTFPRLVVIPGQPVYFASSGNSNYFFYDGMYWVYQGDEWYAASWFDGPWTLVAPLGVPSAILRVPVRYYRRPPTHFRGGGQEAPPRWDAHWGADWARQRAGWEDRDRIPVHRAAPLPVYQRQYSGNRYPHRELQQALQGQNYRHQPVDPAVKSAYEAQGQHHGLPPSRQSTLPSPHVEPGMAYPHARNDHGGDHAGGHENGKDGNAEHQGNGHD